MLGSLTPLVLAVWLAPVSLGAVAPTDVDKTYDRFEDVGTVTLSVQRLRLHASTVGEPGVGFATHAIATLADAKPISRIIFLLDDKERVDLGAQGSQLVLDADALGRITKASKIEAAVYTGSPQRVIVAFDPQALADLAEFAQLARINSPEAEAARQKAAEEVEEPEPTTQQALEFGNHDLAPVVQGRRALLLLDVSGSTEGRPRIGLQQYLSKMIHGFPDGQVFEVGSFGWEYKSAFGRLARATAQSRAQALQFVEQARSRGSDSGLIEGMEQALRLRAEHVVLLTDGNFADVDKTLTEITTRLERGNLTLHLVLFTRERSPVVHPLQSLAVDSGGQVIFVVPQREND
jgi:hypothetical protein